MKIPKAKNPNSGDEIPNPKFQNPKIQNCFNH
jgi:hypothetical protein